MYEVELKYPLATNGGNERLDVVIQHLEELGASRGAPLRQRDTYFAHPSRDFAVTDEAFRLRTQGESNVLTYKGPLVDTQSKTRHEIEVALAAGQTTAGQCHKLLDGLGFRPVREISKVRVAYGLEWEGRHVELSVDDVDGLGRFIEIETLAEDSERTPARDSIIQLARKLGLTSSERRSYLCLLLEKESCGH